MAHQTSHYAGWLLWLNVEYWMTLKAKAGKRGTCCSLRLSEMTGQRGEWTVNSHLLCLCTFNWAFGAGIINMQLQSPWECAREVRACVCVCLVCVFVYVCGSLLICVPWVSRGHWVPLCAERVRRREAHLDMRSQIIHLTLRREGSVERRRAKLKESEEKTGNEERETKGRKANKRMNGVNRKRGRRKQIGQKRKQWWEVCAFERANRRDGAKKKIRARQRLNAIVLSYQDGRAVLLPTASQCALEGLVLRWWP